MNKAWLILLLAGLLEIGWAVSLKILDGFTGFSIAKIPPLISYALFGLAAAFCLSQAMKHIPLSTAYPIWMGIAFLGTIVVDSMFYGVKFSFARLICVLLIAAGVVGLKLTNPIPEKPSLKLETPAGEL